MRRILASLIFVLLSAVSVWATQITVSSSTVNGYQYSDAAPTVRIYVSQGFLSSTGEWVPPSVVGGTNFFRTISCTANTSTHVLSIPSFILPSTVDASPNVGRYTLVLFTGSTKRETIYSNFRMPTSYGVTITVAQWVTDNQVAPSPPRPGFPDTQQVQTMINAAPASALASDVIAGRSKLSVAAADSLNPIAAGTNDGRFNKLESDGDLVSTGTVTVGADSDASGTDGVILQTRGTTRFTVNNNGTLTASTKTLTLGDSTATDSSRIALTSQSTDVFSIQGGTSNFTNGAACGTTNYKDNTLFMGYNSAANGTKINSGLVNYGWAQESKFCSGSNFVSEVFWTWTDPTNLISVRPFGFSTVHSNGDVGFTMQGDINFFRQIANGGGQSALWHENGGIDLSFLSTGGISFQNNQPSTGGIRWRNAAGNNTIAPIYVDNSDDTIILSSTNNVRSSARFTIGGVDTGDVRSSSETDTYIELPGSNILRFVAGGAIKGHFDTTGLVMNSALTFDADNTYDFGKTGGSNFRPRDAFIGRNLEVANQIQSTVTTGTAPLVVASTTNVPNLNASSLSGATFSAPGAIGGGTPSTGAFTTLTSTGGALNGTVGAGTPAAGTFTTAAASTSLTVGGGTAITKILKGSVTIDPASINATTVSSQTFTLTGAATGDSLVLNPSSAGLTAGMLVSQVFVSAANTITVVFYNTTGSPIDLASASWTYSIIR